MLSPSGGGPSGLSAKASQDSLAARVTAKKPHQIKFKHNCSYLAFKTAMVAMMVALSGDHMRAREVAKS